MKLLRIPLLLLCLALLPACISEGNSDCPTDRHIILELAYEHNGTDVFDQQVQSVDLFVFDRNNLLVHRQTVGSTQLNAFAGADLSHLAPGDYRIVAWGNATSQTTFGGVNPGDHFNGAHAGRHGVPRNTAPHSGNGDRLHFAPGTAQEAFMLTIPTWGNLTATLPFARAYIGIEVFIVGFAEHTGQPQPPIVEITGAASHFSFDRIPEGDITLSETAVIQTQFVERPAMATFRTKLFDNDTDFAKTLRIRSQTAGNEVHFTISNAQFREMVAAYMANNGIASLKNDPAPQRTIPIEISFGDQVAVSVEVREFERVPAPPIW